METKQIVILLLSLLLVVYEWVKDRKKKRRAKSISDTVGEKRPPVAASAAAAPLLPKVLRAVADAKAVSPKAAPSVLPEEGVRVTCDSAPEDSPEHVPLSSEADEIEELRKAVVWSEILQTKF